MERKSQAEYCPSGWKVGWKREITRSCQVNRLFRVSRYNGGLSLAHAAISPRIKLDRVPRTWPVNRPLYRHLNDFFPGFHWNACHVPVRRDRLLKCPRQSRIFPFHGPLLLFLLLSRSSYRAVNSY